jgi:hypothetical protein
MGNLSFFTLFVNIGCSKTTKQVNRRWLLHCWWCLNLQPFSDLEIFTHNPILYWFRLWVKRTKGPVT